MQTASKDEAREEGRWVKKALDGVIELVRFPLIEPDKLRDQVQPKLTVGQEPNRLRGGEGFG